jgi:Tfp pilus assembly protein PilN
MGFRTRVVDPGLVPEASAIELLAAATTLGRATIPLRSPGVQRAHVGRMRNVTRGLALAAAAALLVGIALDRWRVQRALTAVQQARAELAAPVRDAMTLRSGIESAAEVASALAAREANATRVNGVLAAVAVALPSGATLTAMQVTGDSVTIEGESARSALVYDALRTVPAFEQVKLAAPLRQERQAGDVAVEHFAFSARLRSR